MSIYIFLLLRMTDIVTSQNIDPSFWDAYMCDIVDMEGFDSEIPFKHCNTTPRLQSD
jgi:hypothetical protein